MTLEIKRTRRERADKALSIADVSKEKTKRLNVEIPKSKHDALKKLAVDQDKTIAELVNLWVDDLLKL